MAKPDHASDTAGAIAGKDLKSRIQGFGGGPEPPPLEETFWGSLFGSSPHDEQGVVDSLSTWYEDAVKGFDTMLNDIAEEIIGEPASASSVTDAAAPEERRRPAAAAAAEKPAKATAQAAQASDSPGIDAPGRYRVIGKETFLSNSLVLGGKVLCKLEFGEEVTIEEVVHRPEDNRVRGRTDGPPSGWISLFNLQNGYRWAERIDPPTTLRATQDPKRQSGEQPSSLKVSGFLKLETDDNLESNQQAAAEVVFAPEPAQALLDLMDTSVEGTAPSAGSASTSSRPVADDEALQVGDRVLRKGKEAIIVSIDRTLDPPAFTIQLCEDGREIGSEQHLLRKVATNAEAPASATPAPSTANAVLAHQPVGMADILPAPECQADLLDIGGGESEPEQQPQEAPETADLISQSPVTPEKPCTVPAAVPLLPPPPSASASGMPLLPPPPGGRRAPAGNLLAIDEDAPAIASTPPPAAAPSAASPTAPPPLWDDDGAGFTEDFWQAAPAAAALALAPVAENEVVGSSLPRGMSMFDPVSVPGRGDAGYPSAESEIVAGNSATISVAAPSAPVWKGCAAPRGVSIFDPLSDKN